ncbi:MAG: hypothetical protein GY821_11665 [Gammaproteobacteria bacterium]|nr:hypothetical protein [Gammaproteobacteria bacterium]MCP4475196.1 hypothetical protein [Gammaproteobacteria bacterium]
MDSNSNCGSKNFCICKLGIALALTAALFTFILGICGWLFGYGAKVIALYASIYPGFNATFLGSIIGAIWAFVEVFIFVIIAGFLYCAFTRKCNKCFCCNRGCKKVGDQPNNDSNNAA